MIAVKKLTAKAMSEICCKAASASATSASTFYLYQPKMPKSLKPLKRAKA